MSNSSSNDPLSPNLTSLYSPLMGSRPWLMNTIGIIEIIVGFLLLFFPLFTGLVSIWVGGWLFIFLAGIQLFQIFSTRSHGMLWSIISLILYLLIGIYMITEPAQAMGSWTLVLGIYILVAGLFRLGLAFKFRSSPGSGITIFNGVVTTLLGAVITFTWPQSSFWVIGTIIAVELLMTGWTMIYLGTIATKDKKNSEKS